MKQQKQNELKTEVVYVNRALPIVLVAITMFVLGMFAGGWIDHIADNTQFILNLE